MGTHYKGNKKEIRALDAFIKLNRASESLNSRLSTQLNEWNLTVSQFGALEALYHLGPMNLSELSQKLLKSGGNITMVADNLEKRGLLVRKRSKTDRRYVKVELTYEGKNLIESIFPEHVTNIVNEMIALDPGELEELSRLCKKLGRKV
ncbi:MAG TPA: MarR family transcriptional regulator [Balneolales bacterium]|nr:MarR family transcriptional regulator [Balneolales bacterium]